ncbi:MAG: CAP domain-containing protein [Myxococcota bacterium]
MRRHALTLLLLAGCEPASTANPDAGALDGGLTTEQQAWLSAHDAVRAAAMPRPSPALPTTHWSPTAASLAEDWAARCVFDHRPSNTLGENLFASTNATAPAAVVDDWAAEKADYDYGTNTCATGKACGHYTQLVWRSSTGLGCAQRRCTTGSPFGAGAWTFTVCDYEPAGNIRGQTPY